MEASKYFLPTCHKGLHDHLHSVISLHFWRFFLTFFKILCIFCVNWTIFILGHLRWKTNSKFFLVEVTPEPL